MSALERAGLRIRGIEQEEQLQTHPELAGAKLQFSIFQDASGALRVLHSEQDEELLALLLSAFHHHKGIHDLTKLALLNIEKFRSGKLTEANYLLERTVEYIQLQKSKNLYL
ncbi:hypothetical protein [Cnuella takakiae]|uniref:hypothetical protein n=1 Tax=Cnuella takakiae TaxID=1302690 RepID=UPI0011605142|nr:hypothetical protein [Cnuella takakiae]